MQIPFVNLRAQHESIKSELGERLGRTLQSFQFLHGADVRLFEEQFSRLLGIPSCVATANGTDSLLLTLKALGVGPGGEVITPAFSWISSAETISSCGATPVFVDADSKFYTLDAQLISKKLTPRTKGIIVVHLYGQAAPVHDIKKLCDQHNLFLIEDCAQAHLTAEANQPAGTIGDAGCFSFYPTKNLGAYGDAGCVVTANEALAEKIRRLANHGALNKDDHEFEGINSRMDTIQAAVLLAKLPYLRQWNERRRKLAQLYSRALDEITQIQTPATRPNTEHTFHLYVITAERRDALKEYLLENGVQSIIHYPRALPNLPAYRYMAHQPADFPVASRLQHQVLSLPLYPELTEAEVDYVCEKIRSFYKK